MKKNTEEELQSIILRLTNENKRWRMLDEEIKVILRRRTSSLEELTLSGAVKSILDSRDFLQSKIDLSKENLRKILSLLINNKPEEAKKEINIFLQKNK